MSAATWVVGGVIWAVATPGVVAQLAERAGAVEDGVVRFTYETRAEVEICDQGIRMGDRDVWWRSRGWDGPPRHCRYGWAEVELRIEAGLVRDVEILRRTGERTEGAIDLGQVTADGAAAYLFTLAREGATRHGSREAILAAVLADVDDVWRDLIDLAEDPGVRDEARKTALFWIGQEAAAAATEGLAGVASDEDEDQEIRDAAIFALSQRPVDEGVPALMELARTARESRSRRSAMFWLAQSDDDRVIGFFEQILLRRGQGN